MGKVIVEQIISADGYAADANGGIDFFFNAKTINQADKDQVRMLETVEAIVLGRTTYGMFADYWPKADPAQEPVAEPLNRLPKYVVANTLDEARWGDDTATILRGDGVESVRALRGQFTGDLIIWGSLTLCDALLCAGEVDVLRLRIVPVLIGQGRSFAPPDLRQTDLELASIRHYDGGFVVIEYHLGTGDKKS